jgi:hypothetical protein
MSKLPMSGHAIREDTQNIVFFLLVGPLRGMGVKPLNHLSNPSRENMGEKNITTKV